jgi:hypothetical protein
MGGAFLSLSWGKFQFGPFAGTSHGLVAKNPNKKLW